MFVTWIGILVNNINLLNPHLSVLSYCYMFSVKNWVFRLLDRIAPKLPKKITKNSRIMTNVERDFLRSSAPRNPKFHRLDPFFIFFNSSYSQKNPNFFALVLFDF